MPRVRSFRPLLVSVVFLGLASASAAPTATAPVAAAPMPLAAHHAVYKLTLLKATGAKAPESVDGLLTYDFSGSACDGYSSTLRQMTALQPQEGDSRVSEMKMASFEGGDAQDFRFKVDNKAGGSDAGQVDGNASRSSDGSIAIALHQPKTEKTKLDPGILFPTEHLKRVLETAEAGGHILSAKVFDGSDPNIKVFNTLAVIGNESHDAVTEKPAQIDALKTVRRWPVSISYFDASKPDDPPEYVLSFTLYEDGISSQLKLDYGDFVLQGDMTELKLLPASASCSK